ncbi:hypothetical protein AN478_04575 [Thiohalorhabdus denitrificans]|uniref:Uncharacterized protein n=1 Tax=Thiohalorhabdus denitrificans TaxID=381306 RepID=A0A0N8PNC9_9GAMM|nr:hypothetical protein [Thiohalorhabdus denitrificans]KPV41173.1 hypothetical protein AN478_04575 [Thiohalorhabdus denitrificans]SCY35694.1 hypothetical protein SAMN05661077_1860 [Thiohalorhabdus denitrificans]
MKTSSSSLWFSLLFVLFIAMTACDGGGEQDQGDQTQQDGMQDGMQNGQDQQDMENGQDQQDQDMENGQDQQDQGGGGM